MEFPMRYQTVHGDERFAARFARVRSFARMYATMFDLRLFPIERFAAQVAGEFAYIQMYDVNVTI